MLRDSPRQVDRNGKTHATVVATDERVDADHPPVDVTKRAAAVAGVDRGVGLDELIVISAEAEIASFRTHHAESESVGQLKRCSDREGEFPDLKSVAVPQLRHRKIGAIDLQNSQVAPLIRTHDLGLEAPPIAQFHLNPTRSIDDMVVGENVAVGGKNEPRADIGRRVFLGFPGIQRHPVRASIGE